MRRPCWRESRANVTFTYDMFAKLKEGTFTPEDLHPKPGPPKPKNRWIRQGKDGYSGEVDDEEDDDDDEPFQIY